MSSLNISLVFYFLFGMMSSKTKLCTCQKFCQAPPEGKAIPLRTWYRHAGQRALEEGMDLGVREAQQRRHLRNMKKVCISCIVFYLIQTFSSLSGQTSADTARAKDPFRIR
jgi:ribosomal protein S26